MSGIRLRCGSSTTTLHSMKNNAAHPLDNITLYNARNAYYWLTFISDSAWEDVYEARSFAEEETEALIGRAEAASSTATWIMEYIHAE